MISETGSKRRRSGFTLIEIVLVLGLIALASSVFLVNFNAFNDRRGSTNPSDILRQAIRDARFQAAADRVVTKITYDEENGVLLLRPGERAYPLGASFGSTSRGEIRFYLLSPGEGLSTPLETADSQLRSPCVQFAPDRSSSPFVVEIDSGQGNPERLVFDPFSSIVRGNSDKN